MLFSPYADFASSALLILRDVERPTVRPTVRTVDGPEMWHDEQEYRTHEQQTGGWAVQKSHSS